ncbi:MAG: hypothetical protein E6I02_07620 [Chloroflexi bacterium]|nr:MAG: hypothetical protein E6I02_07620 [Chloroflexota bacterium]
MSILRGLDVIEVSGQGSAAMAAKHMADFGASVTMLEPPEGSPLRKAPPYYETDGERRSATWEWLSRGKTAVRSTPEAAREACASADVVFVESEMALAVLRLKPAELRGNFEGGTTCVLITPLTGRMRTTRPVILGSRRWAAG